MTKGWGSIYLGTAAFFIVALILIFLAVPRDEGEILWTEQMFRGGWMAWSFPVALFFWTIALVLAIFTILAIQFPETPRVGILGIETTRGDRLFISLLAFAFINLAWLGFEFGPQLYAVIPCAIAAFIIFKWV